MPVRTAAGQQKAERKSGEGRSKDSIAEEGGEEGGEDGGADTKGSI